MRRFLSHADRLMSIYCYDAVRLHTTDDHTVNVAIGRHFVVSLYEQGC